MTLKFALAFYQVVFIFDFPKFARFVWKRWTFCQINNNIFQFFTVMITTLCYPETMKNCRNMNFFDYWNHCLHFVAVSRKFSYAKWMSYFLNLSITVVYSSDFTSINNSFEYRFSGGEVNSGIPVRNVIMKIIIDNILLKVSFTLLSCWELRIIYS